MSFERFGGELKDEKAVPAEAVVPQNDSSLSDDHKLIDDIRIAIRAKLMTESISFLARKNVADSSQLKNESDRERIKIIQNLCAKVERIADGFLAKKDQEANWKEAYQSQLVAAVKESLLNKKLDKYNPLQKIGIALLNLILVLSAPISMPIKSALTGTGLFSLTGKPKERVQETLEMIPRWFAPAPRPKGG